MDRHTILRHIMLVEVFAELFLTSCSQDQLGPKPVRVTLHSFQDHSEPSIGGSIIPIEQIRPEGVTRSIADKEIQEAVIVIINQTGIASSPYTRLGANTGGQGNVSKSAVLV